MNTLEFTAEDYVLVYPYPAFCQRCVVWADNLSRIYGQWICEECRQEMRES